MAFAEKVATAICGTVLTNLRTALGVYLARSGLVVPLVKIIAVIAIRLVEAYVVTSFHCRKNIRAHQSPLKQVHVKSIQTFVTSV